MSRPMALTNRSAMRSASESSWGEIEERLEPSDDYLDLKMERD